ncbi:hypothetical protein [Daejeonella oryzae]|uniref:hypothetical protein n=1 Tax=Daejeonella oryzae TaxID=1122943 RepID=UPI0004269065|nr:hypothetical protein [Daejeonella oryzae]
MDYGKENFSMSINSPKQKGWDVLSIQVIENGQVMNLNKPYQAMSFKYSGVVKYGVEDMEK